MKTSTLGLLAAALLLGPLSASAIEVQWLFEGVVDEVGGADTRGINAGDPFSYILHFDTAAPVTNPGACGDGGIGTICSHDGDPGLFFTNIQIGPVYTPSFSSSSGDQYIKVRNNTPDPDGHGDVVDGYSFSVGQAVDPTENVLFLVSMRGPEDLDLVTDGRILPELLSPELVHLRVSVFQICDSYIDLDCQYFGLNGHFTSIVAVPEPQTSGLMIAGIGALGLVMLRRRRR